MRLYLSLLIILMTFVLSACNQKPESLIENEVTEALSEIYISKDSELYKDWIRDRTAAGLYKGEYADGSPRASVIFEAGLPVDGDIWDEEGNRKLSFAKEDGKYLQIRYHANGNKHSELVLENGVYGVLEFRGWYEDGHPETEHNGELIRNWYPGGQMESEAHFRDGTLHGRTAIWHENGQLAGECFYVNGELDGAYVEWDEEGNLVTDKLYESGELISESM